MRFSCSKKELSEALSILQRAVSSKSSLPVLEGILLKAVSGCINLCSYDLEIGMTTTVSATVSEQGEIVLNARIFTDMVKKMPAEKIEISSNEKLLTVIKSGATEFTILGIPASEFPELPSLMEGTKISLSQETLSSMIRQTLFAVATDDSKPVITGSLFEFMKGSIRITSVDGYRLAIRTEKINTENELSFVVPGKTLSEISKMLLPESEDSVLINVGKRHILFELNGYSIISRLLEGEFLDYRNVLGKQYTTEITVKVRDFIDSVDRTSLIISERLKSPPPLQIRRKYDQDKLQHHNRPRL